MRSGLRKTSPWPAPLPIRTVGLAYVDGHATDASRPFLPK